MASSIAVVISTYNAPDFLRLTLEAYRQQTDLHFAIYIADDGSSAATANLIHQMQQQFPVPIHHIWQADRGFRKARIHNETFRQIKEPYTLLTDGDCMPTPKLIAAHRKQAQAHCFLSGSRILLAEAWTHSLCQHQKFTTTQSGWWWLQQRLHKNINRLFPLLMPSSLSTAKESLKGIRGCHLSCATSALLRVNGFDESFVGWGREDSDLTARLLHAGFKRCNLRGTPVLHLWHQEFSRSQLADNDTTLKTCLAERRIEAVRGLKQLGDIDA
ncbi:MAG: glycosyltransferase [Mariprofundus sp.]|nr:glycosyltransferase [Mariprofundus sp.]